MVKKNLPTNGGAGEDIVGKISGAVADTVKIRLRVELTHLSPSVIEPDPTQPRQEFDAEGLNRLAESLRTYGQLQPILIRQEKGRNIIISGERRWRAAKIAKLPSIQCQVCRGDVKSIQLVENLLREDLKPLEQAKAFKALMEREKWGVRELARQLNIEHSGISRALKLLRLPEEVQSAVDSGTLAPTTAVEIAKRPREEQVGLAQKAVTGEIKGDDLRRERAAAPVAPAPKPKPLPALTLGVAPRGDVWLFGYGRRTVEVSGHKDLGEMIDVLERALKAARQNKPSLSGGR